MKRVIVDQIEITSFGHIQIRMRKQFVDGADVYELDYHRTAIEVGGDVAAQMAFVNADLATMSLGQVSSEEINAILAHAKIAFTPERIAAFTKLKKAQQQDK